MAEKDTICPFCKSELSVPEEYVGLEVTCPDCDKNFVAAEIVGKEASAAPSNMMQLKLKNFLNKQKNNNEPAAAEEEDDELAAIDEEVDDELAAIEDEDDDELAVIDDEEGDDLVELDDEDDDDGFAVIDEENEDDLPEPDPGFVDEHILKTNFSKKNMKIIFAGWGSLIGSFFILMKSRVLEKEVAIALLVLTIVLSPLALLFYWLYCKLSKSRLLNHWKRDLVRQYFSAHAAVETGLNMFEKAMYFVEAYIPFVNIIPMIINGIAKAKRDRYSKFREPIYDEVKELDQEYLEKLNVLHRFGKDKTQLVSPMETLFAPAFDGVRGLMHFQAIVSENDEEYRYNLEEVTKIYTFEDQLFIYTGIWVYSLGKMISEKTEAFFFKDITDITTESEFKIHTKYMPKGCLSVIIPWLGKPIKTVYKESESFVLTAASGNSIGLTIGFEDAIAVTGASYSHRNDNERVIHAIRKMIEEKKVANNG